MWQGRARNFIIRERLYVWLLLFVVSVNVAFFLMGEEGYADRGRPELKSYLQKKVYTKEEAAEFLKRNQGLGLVLSFFSFAVFFAIAAGLFLDLLILILKKEGGTLLFPAILQDRPHWGVWDVCKVVILFLWFAHILVFVEFFLVGLFPIIKNENLRSLLNVTLTDILVFFFIIYFVVYQYREGFYSLGLSLKGFLRNIFYGLAGYLATVPLLVLVLILTILAARLLRYEPPAQPVLEIFLGEKKAGIIMYLTLFVSVFGPILEEVFFRGFMYRAVKAKFGFRPALFSTSAVFALLHANLVGFLPIMILGMLLAYLFERTGTLIAPCTVHILHNSVMVVLVFMMKAALQ